MWVFVGPYVVTLTIRLEVVCMLCGPVFLLMTPVMFLFLKFYALANFGGMLTLSPLSCIFLPCLFYSRSYGSSPKSIYRPRVGYSRTSGGGEGTSEREAQSGVCWCDVPPDQHCLYDRCRDVSLVFHVGYDLYFMFYFQIYAHVILC